jgi:hypothetical protein
MVGACESGMMRRCAGKDSDGKVEDVERGPLAVVR